MAFNTSFFKWEVKVQRAENMSNAMLVWSSNKEHSSGTGSLDSNPKSTAPKVYRDFSMTRDLTGKIKSPQPMCLKENQMRHYIKEASMNGSLANASLPLSLPSSSAALCTAFAASRSMARLDLWNSAFN